MSASELARHTAEQLRLAMKVRGVTQSELAHRIGVTQGRVAQILSGRTNSTLRTLYRIADALGGRVVIRVEPFAALDAESKMDWCE